ncbi:Transducin/WD40 repeat superfamily protein [Heracleum sosnowskyi]|uniref:Transducin/WD40 repeat superfamily protein n=1 Tax=Heracleum sosnowskyi TaxID=360622 RepID=A0AAD8MXD2_9APIA|nr:Transducin/WD40 repeat superfamily protein [Heracleum sosnowskyi]
MGGHSFPSAAATEKESNLQRLLNSLTPIVPLKPIPEVEQNCIQSLNSEWNTSEKPITECFMLRDLWKCFEEWSAYGRGTEVILPDGETVLQYFTPYVSAVQISIKKRIQKVDSVANGSCNGTKFLGAENKCTELLRSSSNTSGNSKFWNSSSGSNSIERKEVCLFKHHFEFHDDQNPYTRLPFFDKIQNLAKNNPGLMTLRSTDLLPSSWMAVAWYPIYHIPVAKGVVKDLTAAFITFHTLSSFNQDTGVDPAGANSGIGGSKAVNLKKGTKMGHRKMPLPPFGLAALYLTGDVWFISGESDEEKYIDLYNAARSWLKKHHFYHHDFNFFANNSCVRAEKN